MTDVATGAGSRGRRLGLAALVALFALPLVWGAQHVLTQRTIFAGILGPTTRTGRPPARPTGWRHLAGRVGGRLPILLTDEVSAWLGLAHGLRWLGVPFTVTRDAEEAARPRRVGAGPRCSDGTTRE